jgi:hypothetical protein
MFKRRWKWFGDLVSDEGFSLKYGNKSVTYTDEHGSFSFGLEDGILFPNPTQVIGTPVPLGQPQLDAMIDRIIRGLRSEGHEVKVNSK